MKTHFPWQWISLDFNLMVTFLLNWCRYCYYCYQHFNWPLINLAVIQQWFPNHVQVVPRFRNKNK